MENLKTLKDNMLAVGNKLIEITDVPKERIYFTPPGTQKLVYPCIIFEINSLTGLKGSNTVYFSGYNYSVTYITSKSTDEVVDKLQNSEICYYNGHFVSDNLHHFRFSLNGNVL